MGEGWSDFHALLFMVREGQDSQPGNENWMGAYGVGNYAVVHLQRRRAVVRHPAGDLLRRPGEEPHHLQVHRHGGR